MLKLEELKELITLIDQSSIDEFDYETEGEKVSLRKKMRLYKSQLRQHQSSRRQALRKLLQLQHSRNRQCKLQKPLRKIMITKSLHSWSERSTANRTQIPMSSSK